MFIEVYDDDVPAVVWLFCGRSNVDDDHRRWLASMQRLDQVAIARGRPGNAVALLIIDADNPSPPREHRDGITAVARHIEGKTPLAVVTSSSLARTIIAGLHFAHVVRFPLKGFADVDAAVAWLGSLSKVASPALQALVAEARAKESLQGGSNR
ncbi:MAG: hypothetical protein Q8O67_01285 [Deltaproteobacteria bacterium]|nr:hypothetical protein [Deltaproteobacteria bacterium]